MNRSVTRVRTRPLPPTKGMNRLEADYALHLSSRGLAWRYESVKLRLGDGCWYTPDFEVRGPEGLLEYHEVKGFWRDDARVKIKTVAELYPERVFFAATRPRKSEPWRIERFDPHGGMRTKLE